MSFPPLNYLLTYRYVHSLPTSRGRTDHVADDGIRICRVSTRGTKIILPVLFRSIYYLVLQHFHLLGTIGEINEQNEESLRKTQIETAEETMISPKRNDRLVQCLILISLLSLCYGLQVDGLIARDSSIQHASSLPRRSRHVLLFNSMEEDDDSEFRSLYNEQASEFGTSMSKEFRLEQDSRTLQLEVQRQSLEERFENDRNTSAGLFASRRPTTRSTPTIPTVERTRVYDSWTKEPNRSNGDNLFLIMTTSMSASATQQSQPVMVSIASVLLVLCLSLSFFNTVGEEPSSVNMNMNEIVLLSPKFFSSNALD